MRARLFAALSTLLTIALLVTWFLLFRPLALGGSATWIVIRGSSMQPVYHTGDLVIVQSASEYRIGDIAAYRVPGDDIGAGMVVIHRLTGGDAVNGFEVTGDNNDAVDPWKPTQADMVGRAWVAIPGLGRVIAWMHDPIVLGGIVSAIVVSYVIARPAGPKPERSPDLRPDPRFSRSPRRFADQAGRSSGLPRPLD